MKKNRILLASLMFLFLLACTEKEDWSGNSSKSSLYEITEEYLNGWDEGYFNESGYYILLHTDSLQGVNYAYINKTGENETKSICYWFDWDFEPIGLQVAGKCYLVDRDRNSFVSAESPATNGMKGMEFRTSVVNGGVVATQSGNASTRAEGQNIPITKRLTNASKGIGNISSIVGYYDLVQGVIEGEDLGTFLSQVANIGVGIYICILIPEAAIVLTVLSLPELHERFFEIPYLVERIYGDACIEIDDMIQDTHSSDNFDMIVNVTVSNIENLPTFFLEDGEQEIYAGVVILEGPQMHPIARLDYCTYKSGEELVEKEPGNSIQMQFFSYNFPILRMDKEYYIRPYLRSSHVNASNIQLVRYGKQQTYKPFKSGITDFDTSILDADSYQICFSNHITAVLQSSAIVMEWGIYIIDEKGNRNIIEAPIDSKAFQYDAVVKVPISEMDYFNSKEYIAKKRIKLGTWVRSNLKYEFSVPDEYIMIYDQPISVKFDSYEEVKGPYQATTTDPDTGETIYCPGLYWYDFYLHYTITGAPFVQQAYWHINQYEWGPPEHLWTNGLIYCGESPIHIQDGDNAKMIRQLTSTTIREGYVENWEWIVLETAEGKRIITDNYLYYKHDQDKGLNFTENIDVK